MARVVVVHGVGQEYLGRRTLQAPVAAALADGVETAANAGDVPADTVPAVEDVDVAFYGDAFRTPGAKAGPSGSLSVDDVTDPYEQELLLAWADAAARGQAPRTGTKAPTPQVVQRAMNTLLRSPFLPGPVAERFLLGVLRQVRRYFGEDAVRARAIEAVTVRVGPDTTVLVGHSLGSVVAYEALCAHPEWPVRTLVTLGSPLGMPTLVHDRLRPAPLAGRGHWPAGLTHWTNLADRHDVVASVKELADLFRPAGSAPGGVLRDVPVDNGWKVHDLLRHLTARETGAAIGEGLRAG
ncbi:alpha/beta hydrolase [Streptomyces sp. McG3]|uniref:alpha/beta hydrolase n=1 Tax=Streptomyces sp. McG3 TaxID=2725483 RepID=UPI001BE5D4AC|nr:alpha/beta hydrolase [Streptomyces sp. McG3]MBT2895343.1 alpha/beta hydrolase [Streptomyces sp. McG3]